MDEELRLIATFQDRIGPGLKGSIDKIRQFTKEGVRGSEEGEKSVKKHAKAFQELREKIKYTADLTREEFLPGLEKTALTAATAGIGLGTLTAAIGLAASAAKGFGETMAELQRGARATGLSADDLRKWQNFGEIVGITADQMKTGLAGFNELVEKMQRRPDVFRQMFANFDMAGMAALRDFMLSLKDLPRDQQLDKVMQFIATIKDVGQQKQVLKFLGLPPEIADDLQHYRENIDRAKASITQLTQTQIDQGAEAQKNWIELGQKFQDLSIVIGAKFSPAMSEATEELRLWITENQGAWSDQAGKWFTEITADAKIFKDWLQGIVDVLNQITAWESKMPTLFPKGWLLDRGSGGPGQIERNPDGSLKEAPGKGIHIPNWGPWHSGGTPSGPIIPAPGQKPLYQQSGPGMFHPASFTVGGEGGGGGGLSKGTSDMINIIAAGTRRGVYDGLMDFSQTSAVAGGGGGGGGLGGVISKASLTVGGGGGGGGGGNRGIGGWWTPDRMSHAVDRLMKEGGLSREGAAGLVARWSSIEASGGPTSRNPISGAAGIGQWLGSRKNADAVSGDFDRNLTHAIEELKGSEKRAGDVLRNAKTPWEGARGASMFERAEGYSGRTGTDNFTASTPVGKVLSAIDKAKNNVAGAPGHSKVGGSDPIDPSFLQNWGQNRGREQEASLLRASRQANAGTSKVTGEASLSIKLAGGLAPDGGAKTRGDLFKEIKISRGSIPYASTEA